MKEGMILAKTSEEKLQEVEQKIHRLQKEKKKLQKQKENEERKKRDHALILVGAHFLTHYPEEQGVVINMRDDEITKWVDSKFRKN